MGLLERTARRAGWLGFIAFALFDVLLLRPARAFWRKRAWIGWGLFVFVSFLVTLVVVMHAFVLEPREELRGHDPIFFGISATLFDTLRGREAVVSAMHDVLKHAPHERTVRNVLDWARDHDEPELRDQALERTHALIAAR